MNALQRTHAKWLRSGARWGLRGLLLCTAIACRISDERHSRGAGSPYHAPVDLAATSRLVVPAENPRSDAPSAGEGEHAPLRTEVALLQRAVQAIAQSDPRKALRAIHEYRARIVHPLLSEERDGLSVLAHCLAADAGAARRAALYLSKYPRAVLVPRIERSCGRLKKLGLTAPEAASTGVLRE